MLIRSQAHEVVGEITDMRNDMTTIRADTKKAVQEANQEMMEYVNNKLDERLALLEARQTGPKEIEKKQVK